MIYRVTDPYSLYCINIILLITPLKGCNYFLKFMLSNYSPEIFFSLEIVPSSSLILAFLVIFEKLNGALTIPFVELQTMYLLKLKLGRCWVRENDW